MEASEEEGAGEMRPKEFDIDPANANLIGFASNVTGAAFTLTANDSGDSLAHRVSIRNDSGTNHAGKTVTLVGTDADGHSLTEVVTGPGAAATVESAGYFLTLTSATPSATIGADTFDIGWVDEISTQTIPVNWRCDVGPRIGVDVTGTIDYTVNEAYENVQVEGQSAIQAASQFPITALTAQTTDVAASGTPGATAIWLVVNSYTDTAEIQMHLSQPDSY